MTENQKSRDSDLLIIHAFWRFYGYKGDISFLKDFESTDLLEQSVNPVEIT